ncbi:MAG: NTP transferase domain-containing protein [Candidatus Marinimicrobia bacterium]|nr:NTP transferase domain-containing protein [Candidatus Neomarinimicrobiota bacterium]
MYLVILAGGVGKRFWPRSRRNNPKQFLNIASDQSMLKLTYNRLKHISSAEKIFVVARESLREKIQAELTELPLENYISEPSGKSTAPCIGLAAAIIQDRDPDATIGVFPADHLIQDVEKFDECVRCGEKLTEEHDALVTFGIEPTKPATGYGYIQYNESEKINNDSYKVKTFAEKPDKKTAKKFLEYGNFLWNSGMFIWKANTILQAIDQHLPDLGHSLKKISDKIGTPDFKQTLQQEWGTIRKESIDYGVMEKADNVYVVQSDFRWSDVGSWDAVYEIEKKDENNNVIKGDNIKTLETEGCYIYSSGNLISTIGLEDIVVVQEKNATVIARRGETEKIKKLVNRLKCEDKEEYL